MRRFENRRLVDTVTAAGCHPPTRSAPAGFTADAAISFFCGRKNESCYAFFVTFGKYASISSGILRGSKSSSLIRCLCLAGKDLRAMSRSIDFERTALFSALFQDYAGPAFALRLWDGVSWHSSDSQPAACTLVLKNPKALALLIAQPSEVALGEAFIHRDLDVEGDLFSAFSVAQHLFNRPRGLNRRSSKARPKSWWTWAGGYAMAASTRSAETAPPSPTTTTSRSNSLRRGWAPPLSIPARIFAPPAKRSMWPRSGSSS